jgi:hypothetical protein
MSQLSIDDLTFCVLHTPKSTDLTVGGAGYSAGYDRAYARAYSSGYKVKDYKVSAHVSGAIGGAVAGAIAVGGHIIVYASAYTNA